MKEGWEADEDRFYKQVCMDDEESDECKKHRISIEDQIKVFQLTP